jgi:hypothetical protein
MPEGPRMMMSLDCLALVAGLLGNRWIRDLDQISDSACPRVLPVILVVLVKYLTDSFLSKAF